jgi:hypothetical protein
MKPCSLVDGNQRWVATCLLNDQSRRIFGGGGRFGLQALCYKPESRWTVSTATSSQYLAVNCEPIV